MKTMYEVNWHYVDGDYRSFEGCTVSPITVVREGVLPGCSGVSITAVGADGRRFQGSPSNYFNTEVEAWADIKSGVLESIRGSEETIYLESQRVAAMKKFLEELK